MIRRTSLAILAALALATAVASAAPRQQINNATLSSLSLSDVDLGATFDPATIVYDSATAVYTATETTVTAMPTNSTTAPAVTVTDNDTPGVTVSPPSLTVNEGATDTYTVRLITQPSASVTVDIRSDNTDVTVSSPSLTFTTTTWSAEQAVTVTAGQDADADDDTATVTHDPSGADFDLVSNAELAVTITDNDTRGVTVSPASLTVAEGGTGTYTVALDTQPTGDVTVAIGSDNTDLTAEPAALTFTTTNWNSVQTVTVRAAEDDDASDDTAMVTHTVSGGDYASFAASNVVVTVTDNDTPGITVTSTSLTVGEGGSSTYTVVLNTQPSSGVTVTIVDPADNTDVKAEPAALTFTTTNWNTAQTVTVSAVSRCRHG